MFTSKKLARAAFVAIRAEIAAMTFSEIMEFDTSFYMDEFISVRTQWKMRLVRKQFNFMLDKWQGPLFMENRIYEDEPEETELEDILMKALAA